MKLLILLFIALGLEADFIKVDRDEILKAHNVLRAKHFDAPLRYSVELENHSKEWAYHLAKDEACTMIHSKDKFGENLFWASPLIKKSKNPNEKKWHLSSFSQNISSSKPVKDWYDEIKFYDYNKNTCKRGEMCGHYTQVVWKKTKEVGCAAYSCDDKSQVWVCKYYPAGNYVGKKPY